jgi:hypothetical protein
MQGFLDDLRSGTVFNNLERERTKTREQNSTSILRARTAFILFFPVGNLAHVTTIKWRRKPTIERKHPTQTTKK